MSEVTGLALSPDGNRLYFNSERGMGLVGLPLGPGPGMLYEVTGPFRGGTLAARGPHDADHDRGRSGGGRSRRPAPACRWRGALAGAAVPRCCTCAAGRAGGRP